MAYLGRQPVIGNFVKLDAISVVNGQAAYTMQNNSVNFTDYATVNQFLVSLNGTIQSPTSSFTVSGSTLTFASNLVTGDVIDFIIVFGNSLSAGVPTDGTVSLAKLSATGTKDATTFLRGDNTFATAGVAGISSSADATAMTITDAEKIGIGTTDPKEKLDTRGAAVFSGDHVTSANAMGTAHGVMLTSSSGVAKITSISNGSNDVDLELRALNGGSAIANQLFLDDDGNVMFSKNSTSDTVTGIQTTPNGALINILNASGYNLINRQADDGVLIYFKQANSTEGNISVSGTTVSYNGFTGTHWTRLADNSKPTILKGTVLETLDEMVDWYNLEFDVITQDDDGNDITDPQKIPHVLTGSQSVGDVITYNHNGTDYQATIVREADIKHMKSKVSDTTDAKNVYGVFSHWDFGNDDGINDIIVASVGSFVVRIKSGETVAKGDLLQSNGDGTAKVQSDENIKSSSFAKVLSTTKIETYDDGSFIVPCSLMC